MVSDEIFGGGTIVSPDGLIVTNEHVVHGAQSILVSVVGQDRPYKATVLGRDRSADLALLKIRAATPSHFDLNATADVQYGEFVLAFGSPFGLGHSVSFGIVSSPLRETDYGPYRYIQTDAPVNPGNSGGPLVDLHGNLVGINTLIYSFSGGSEGVGFALPLATVRRAVESIRRFGYARRADFGLSLAPYLGVNCPRPSSSSYRAVGRGRRFGAAGGKRRHPVRRRVVERTWTAGEQF